MSDPVVITNGLSKRYGNVVALEDCSLSVERGEVFGLLGPNGAGKTTLLRLLMGYLRPTRGTAHILGRDCCHQSLAVRRQVAYLPGEVRLFRRMRGHDLLKFLADVRGGGLYQQALHLAERLDLELRRRISSMSTGMRQKLALVAALATRVPLIVLDEPTANLDPTVRAEVGRIVAELQAEGRTILFSSHVLSEVEEVCQRVAILRAGRLVHRQVMSDLRRQHRIFLTLKDALPDLPAELQGQVQLIDRGQGHFMIETAGELSPLLGWLGCLPLSEIRIEPLGLRAIYDRFHRFREDEQFVERESRELSSR